MGWRFFRTYGFSTLTMNFLRWLVGRSAISGNQHGTVRQSRFIRTVSLTIFRASAKHGQIEMLLAKRFKATKQVISKEAADFCSALSPQCSSQWQNEANYTATTSMNPRVLQGFLDTPNATAPTTCNSYHSKSTRAVAPFQYGPSPQSQQLPYGIAAWYHYWLVPPVAKSSNCKRIPSQTSQATKRSLN